ncbi:hypothetical protein C5Y96_06060 [Blastopirellula marina]|uniref:Uncharacterized protein n=1 Tax=Blastopirellula marina TaxID=124 RepID=A0A2S8FY21_9BACT|nr:hypothetical protein C5Y96_06060 [Blastopirellula marina]RCS53449.1 hypothetical protein DTL36_06070 [Bremerella cremea]
MTFCLGCGPSTPSTSVEVPKPTAMIKSTLEGYASSGELDSGIMILDEEIAKLKESDSALATSLEQDLAKLKSASGKSAVKKQAESMLEKL